jgi:hypothetical protein
MMIHSRDLYASLLIAGTSASFYMGFVAFTLAIATVLKNVVSNASYSITNNAPKVVLIMIDSIFLVIH